MKKHQTLNRPAGPSPFRNPRLVAACVALLAALGVPLATGSAAGAATSTAAALAPPPVPTSGGYLGGFVDPTGVENAGNDNALSATVLANENTRELSEIGNFDAAIGRPLDLVHVYEKWGPASSLVSNSTLNAVAGDGAIPVIDWGCDASGANSDAAIMAGSDDAYITAYADQLKAYGGPLFLRWYREPNLAQSANWAHCAGGVNSSAPSCTASSTISTTAGYVGAWRHIYNLFQAAGATNVAFMWNPGMGGDTSSCLLSLLWPGPSYVNWIGIDGYSRPAPQNPPNPSFTQLFGGVYQTLTAASYGGKPMMIGETGAINTGSTIQSTYLQGALAALTSGSYSDIHGFTYFDSTNNECGNKSGCNWALNSQGLTEMATVAQNSFFDPTF